MRTQPLWSLLLLAGCALAAPQVCAQDAPPAKESPVDLVVTGHVEASYGEEGAPRLSVVIISGLERGEGPGIDVPLYVLSGEALPKGEELRLYLSGAPGSRYEVQRWERAKQEAAPAAPPPAAQVAKLEASVAAMVRAAQEQDWKALAQRVLDLKLRDPAALFDWTFGESAGRLLTAEYAELSKAMVVEFRATFQGLLAEGAGPFRVFEADGSQAIGLQRRARFAMESPLPLYTVQFDRAGIRLWSFAWVEGGWRYLGKLQALPREPLVLSVRLSHTRIDPTDLDSQTLVVSIRNASEAPVAVPTAYDGRVVRLIGRGREHFWSSRLLPSEPPAQRLADLAPKEERVLLEVSLAEVLRERSPNWTWNWGAHPVPPASPIHRWRELGFEADAVFYVAAEAGRRTLHSKPLRVAISAR